MSYNHKKISSSTVKTYKSCPRKWYYEAFTDLPASSSEATRLGTQVHGILESYLKGESLEEVLPFFSEKAQMLAKRNIEHMWLPEVGTCLVENKFKHYTGIKGEIDCIVPPEYRTEEDLARFGNETNVPMVLDHKTSSSISSYALTEDTIRSNGQVIVYANVALDMYPHCEYVDVLWNYMQTTGSLQKQVLARLSRDEITSKFASRILPFIEEMKAILASEDRQQEKLFKQETKACGDYGGCSRIEVCNPVIESHILDFESIFEQSSSVGRCILVEKGKISPRDSYRDQAQLLADIEGTINNPTEEKIKELIDLTGWEGIVKIDKRKRKSLFIIEELRKKALVVIK